VMRVVDPKVAYSMLHRETPSTVPFHQLPMGVGDPSPPLGGPSPGGPPPIFGQPPPGHGQQRPPVMPGPGVGIGPLPPFQQQPGGGAPPPMFRGPVAHYFQKITYFALKFTKFFLVVKSTYLHI
jgi:hypothetical protein